MPENDIFATTGLSWSLVREDGMSAVRETSTPRVWKELVSKVNDDDDNTHDDVPAL
jgi:hypothetical protein